MFNIDIAGAIEKLNKSDAEPHQIQKLNLIYD